MRYKTLILGVPGSKKCPDEYEASAEALVPRSTLLIVTTALQPVIMQLGFLELGQASALGSVEWGTEDLLTPVTLSLPIKFDAVRFRNFTAGVEGQVIARFD